MEKRQLNLNAPLISARRYSSPLKSSEMVKVTQIPSRHHTRISNMSEWESDIGMTPAVIPFHWEKTPGRPKDDIDSTTTRLPPSRALDAFRRYRSGELPLLPPVRASIFSSGERINDLHKPQVEAFSFNDHATLLEKLNESLHLDEEGNGSESEHDDAFSDALEMLSSEGSRALDKNLSDHCSCLKSSGSDSVDIQTRDFMMKRFLQAAKAAVVETPKYDVKKPLVINEFPKPVRKAVSGPIAVKPSPYDRQQTDCYESEEDDQDRRIPVKRTGRLSWLIIPRFCVKSTLRLLNPLPALKSKKLTPSFPKSISAGRFTRAAKSGPLDRSGIPAPEHQKKKFYSGLLSRDVVVNETSKLPSDSSYKPDLSQLRRYRSGPLSPYRNEGPMSPFHGGVRFIPPPKEVENANKLASSRKLFDALRQVSRIHKNDRRPEPVVEAVEKTVYIDKSSYIKKGSAGTGCRRPEDAKAPRFKFGTSDKVQDSAYADMKPNQRRVPEATKQLAVATKGYRKPGSNTRKEVVKSPLPPPLPDSPSESWLWKTLPSIPVDKPFAAANQRALLHSKQQHQLQKARTVVDPTWEAIVKISNVGHYQLRPYSQEFVPRSLHRQSTS